METVIVSLLCFCFFFLNTFASPTHHHNLCRSDQKNALLSFKNEFQIQNHVLSCMIPYGFNELNFPLYPKTRLWTDSSDCCSWEGVTCDDKLGVVTGLNLSYSGLSGILKPNSSLFRLKHLRSLDLAYNDFKGSSIPFELGKLTRLTRLNLSRSCLSGQIPNELLQLIELVSLDLTPFEIHFSESWVAIPRENLLFTETPFLSALAGNLTNLQELRLSGIDISSIVPKEFANMSFLRSLALDYCNLLGTLPDGVFLLPHIESISLSNSRRLRGSLPEFPTNSSLRVLELSSTGFFGSMSNSIGNLKSLESLDLRSANFYGTLPDSIGGLTSLKWLDLSRNDFSGEVPSSIGNLTSLESLDLSSNNFTGEIPSSISNLTSLDSLDLSSNNFTGEVPSSIGNLMSLKSLDLSSYEFVGEIPSSIGNLMSLEHLDLSSNKFVGEVPSSIGNLKLLESLDLSHNNFTGTFSLILLNQTKLRTIDLSYNQLTVLLPSHIGKNVSRANASSTSYFLSHLEKLALSACNVTEIPEFLRTQRHLWALDLSSNRIKGQIPKWLWKLPLSFLNLSHNSFSHLEGSPEVLRATTIQYLDLSSNAFQGPFPSPPTSTQYLLASANNFTGIIPQSLCKLNSLEILDLSNNNFNGQIPQCLGNASDSLAIVSLANNSLDGSLPDTFIRCAKLTTLNVSHNKLTGKLPRSLLNCKSLEVLNMESNTMNDTFPSWLESLQELKVLILRKNGFYGSMVSSGFPKLQIMDISHNNFFGTLPSDYFGNWSAMFSTKTNEDSYAGSRESPYYTQSVVLTNKGMEMNFERILTLLKAVDFSGNRFRGQILESIGLLKELIVLNFSNNIFTGHIPHSLANLTELNSLDLSQNRLSGKIPPELGNIASLEVINFSHNLLIGRIPQGTQFITQNSSSFEGNPGLCGLPLEETCGANPSPTLPNQESEPQEEEEKEEEVNWIAAAIGYIPGLVFGLTIGHIVFSNKCECFLKAFGFNRQRR